MAIWSQESQETKVTTATTTDILDVLAAANDAQRVKVGMLTMRNVGAADNTITVIKDVGGTDYELKEITLASGGEWQNPFDIVLTGTTDKLEIITSSTSEIHVVCSSIRETA